MLPIEPNFESILSIVSGMPPAAARAGQKRTGLYTQPPARLWQNPKPAFRPGLLPEATLPKSAARDCRRAHRL